MEDERIMWSWVEDATLSELEAAFPEQYTALVKLDIEMAARNPTTPHASDPEWFLYWVRWELGDAQAPIRMP